jgi:hypothetical protein
MKFNGMTVRLNQIITLLAAALATIAASSPFFA